MEKRKLQTRWNDPFFLQEKADVIFKIENNKIGSDFSKNLTLDHEDLAGITLPLPPSSLHMAKLKNCNFAFSIMRGEIGKAEMFDSDFHGSIFDCANMTGSKFFKCDLSSCKITAFFPDSVFEDCDFSETQILGGGSSNHSAIRSKFINCTFSDTKFKNTILRATQFVNCNFKNAEFFNSDMRGSKVEKCLNIESIFFKKMENSPGGIPEWAKQNS